MIGLLGLLAAQALPVPLDPSGPWEVIAKDEGCEVVRAYGPERQVRIGFETTFTSRNPVLLVVASQKMLPEGIGEIPVALDDQVPVPVHYGAFELVDRSLRLVKLFPDASVLPRMAASGTLAVGQRLPVVRTGGMQPGLAAVEKCVTDRLRSWGVDPALFLQGKTAGFTGYAATAFKPENYPAAARAKGAHGRVVLLLTTREDGSVSACKAVASADASLDDGTCAIALQHVRLRPPLDAGGHAMASYAVLPVRWTKP